MGAGDRVKGSACVGGTVGGWGDPGGALPPGGTAAAVVFVVVDHMMGVVSCCIPG